MEPSADEQTTASAGSEDAPKKPRRTIDEAARKFVLAAFCLSGGSALIYEVVWTRELSLVFSSTVYAVSMMLSAFMAGLSIGGYLGGHRADQPKSNPLSDLAAVELGIALFGVLSLFLIRILPAVQLYVLRVAEPPAGVFFFVQMLLAFLVMLVPTTLMGATFPLVSKVSTSSYGNLGRTIGSLYSINTLGAIGGSMTGGFLLIPLIGAKATVIVAATLNLTGSLLLAWLARKRSTPVVATVVVLVLVGAFWLFALPEPSFPLTFGTSRLFDTYSEYQQVNDMNSVVWQKDTPYGRLKVVEDDQTGVRALINGPLPEGAEGPGDRATTSLLALLPLAQAPRAHDALVIGLGTGMTSRAMLDTPVKHVTTVEIDPAIATAADYFMGSKLKADPRWRIVFADARQYLLVSGSRYDIITSEPSQPISEGVSHLFTREFYELAAKRLKPGGVFCQWLPQYLLPAKDFTMMYKTFSEVFPNASVWIYEYEGARSPDLFIVGSVDGERPSAEQVKAFVEQRLDRQGLAKARVYPFPETQLIDDAGDPNVPVNTDDRPLLEFDVPWALAESFRTAHASATRGR